MPDSNDDYEFIPPPFSLALMGHFATGAIKAVVIALLLWLLGVIKLTETFSVESAIVTAALVMIVVELVTSGVERVFVRRHQHPDPGSTPMTVAVAALPLPISFLVGMLTAPDTSGAWATMAVTAAVYWLTLVTLERPWGRGDSQADVRRKLEQTRAMIREEFPPE